MATEVLVYATMVSDANALLETLLAAGLPIVHVRTQVGSPRGFDSGGTAETHVMLTDPTAAQKAAVDQAVAAATKTTIVVDRRS